MYQKFSRIPEVIDEARKYVEQPDWLIMGGLSPPKGSHGVKKFEISCPSTGGVGGNRGHNVPPGPHHLKAEEILYCLSPTPVYQTPQTRK